MNSRVLGLLGVVLALTSCTSPTPSQEVAKPEPIAGTQPSGMLNVAFLVVDGVYNSELVAPMDIFHHTVFHTPKDQGMGMRVFTVAPSLEPITTFEGLRLLPDYAYTSDSVPAIDVLVVPSAENSMGTDLENEEMISWVRTVGRQAQYVMSLCDGAFVLAQAGLCEGRESTTFPSDIARYRETFPELTVHEGLSFVHDGPLITSAGGALSYDPALYLCELLYGTRAAEGIGRGLVIDWNRNQVKHHVVTATP